MVGGGAVRALQASARDVGVDVLMDVDVVVDVAANVDDRHVR